MLQVKAFAFTAYPVTDLTRAKAFYQGVLGLKPGNIWGDDKQGWIEYDLGDGTLAIGNIAGDKWKPSASGPCLALEVADFDAAIATLRGAGTPFTVEPMDTGACRMGIVSDPDGNSLLIHHRKPQA